MIKPPTCPGNRDLYTVANGVVAAVRDEIPENVASATGEVSMPVPLTRETAAGNTIALRIPNGLYAHYAHLAPGSIVVRVGDRVRRGQHLGCIGNSGNARNPHLHFQVSTDERLNAGEGRPYVFTRFGLYGHVPPGGPGHVGAHAGDRPAAVVERGVRFGAGEATDRCRS